MVIMTPFLLAMNSVEFELEMHMANSGPWWRFSSRTTLKQVGSYIRRLGEGGTYALKKETPKKKETNRLRRRAKSVSMTINVNRCTASVSSSKY